jgi:ABC-2 type transport system permease protein
MIKTIARKEFTELLRDGRFRWTALIVFALLLVSLGLGWKNYTTVKREKDAAQADSRKTWENQGERNPHSAAHFGVYAYKPKQPLSLVDSGLDNFSGSSIWVEAHYQNPARNRPIEDATALQRFGELTAAGVLQLLLPLLIIFLTFDAFAGERTSGTLRQVLSLGVPRLQFVAGKMFGVLAALMLLLIPAVLIGVAALALASANADLLASLPRFALMCVGYLLYFVAFIGIALTISAIAATPRVSLVMLLGFWIASCLLIPKLANDIALNSIKTPTGTNFWEAVKKDLKDGIDGHNPADKRTKELEAKILAQYGVTKKEDLPINFSGISLQASEEHANTVYDKHFGELKNLHLAQERLQSLFGIISPFLPARGFSMSMAGTDLRHQQHFTDAVEQYRRDLQKMLNDDLAYNSNAKTAATYRANRTLWEKTPEFQYASPAVNWALGNQILNLILLLFWGIGALILSVWAANRMRAY